MVFDYRTDNDAAMTVTNVGRTSKFRKFSNTMYCVVDKMNSSRVAIHHHKHITLV